MTPLPVMKLLVGALAKTERLVPPMAHQSYPIPVRGVDGLEVVFLYCTARPVPREGLAMLAPRHRAVLNASDGELKEVKEFNPRDVGVNDPAEKFLGFRRMSPGLTVEQFNAREARLFAAYDRLLPLFGEMRDPTVEDAASFDTLFWELSEGPLDPYYRAVGSGFFAWLAHAKPPPHSQQALPVALRVGVGHDVGHGGVTKTWTLKREDGRFIATAAASRFTPRPGEQTFKPQTATQTLDRAAGEAERLLVTLVDGVHIDQLKTLQARILLHPTSYNFEVTYADGRVHRFGYVIEAGHHLDERYRRLVEACSRFFER